MTELELDIEEATKISKLRDIPYEPIIWEILLRKHAQKLAARNTNLPAIKGRGRGKSHLLNRAMPLIDFNEALENALDVFKNQTLISKDPSKLTNADIQLNRAKAASFFEGINNIMHLGHIKELIEQDKYRFKREEELKALKPLLTSFQLAAVSSQHSINFITLEMEKLLKEEEEIDYSTVAGSGKLKVKIKGKKSKNGEDEDEENEAITINEPSKLEKMMLLQSAYTCCIDNMVKVTTGLSKVIQLERYSGGRQWGIEKGSGSKAPVYELPEGGGDGGGENGKHSKVEDISAEEAAKLQIDNEEIEPPEDVMPHKRKDRNSGALKSF